ncbi:hypothetical protein U27_06443 [Candidatus Vecturithrix granuli]|uniref:Phosphate transport regulator n=1 Tax=Vecturithrix granuli TaxID=1499967 RepID=A0A081C4F3_VECG1|nr:hypothetical protein U27_06443 [Candidatus Vecturithrix granuli]
MKSVVTSLLPKETPLELMIAHGEILDEVSEVLEELTRSYFEHKDIAENVRFIAAKECDADAMKFKFRKMLDKNIKVPFPKQTFLYALHLQDDIIDMMEDIAKRMAMNYLDFPLEDEVQKDFMQLVREVQSIIKYLEQAIRELKQVFASSFAKRERKKEEKEIIRVENVESCIDTLTLKLGKWAYSKKNEYNALDLIFFNDLTLIFAKIGDKAENLAEMIRSFTR